MNRQLLLLLLIPTFLQAQLRNFRKTTLDSLQSKIIKGTASLSISYTKDSDKNLIIYSDVSLLYPDSQHLYSFGSNLRYNSFYTGSASSNNRFYASVNVHLFNHTLLENNHLKEKVIAPELFSFYQYDENQGLKQRIQLGANAAIKLVRSKNFRINTGVGFFYEFQRWRMLTDEDIETIQTLPDSFLEYIKDLYEMDNKFNVIRKNVRAQVYLSSHAILNKKLDFDFMFSYQQPFKPPFRGLPEDGPFPVITRLYPRYTFECVLSYKFSKKFSAQGRVYLQHDKGHVSPFASNETFNFIPSLNFRW
jgi:hypothetical protein